MKTAKQIMREAQEGANAIAQSKLCWELTDRSRSMLAQEIYHLALKIALDSVAEVGSQLKNKQIIVGRKCK